MTSALRIAAAGLALALAAPAQAAPPHKPDVPDAEARYSSGTTLRAVPDEWWTTLGDPVLDDLVVEALNSNHDVGAAQARVHQAAGFTLQSVSPLLPTASFDVGLNASPSDNAEFQVSPQLTELLENLTDLADSLPGQPEEEEEDDEEDDPEVTWNGSALFNFGLNIDVGRSAAALRAAQMDAAAAEGDRDAVARVVVQQVVATWLDVRTARARVAVVQRQIATNTDLLELTRARYEGGDARGLDVLQQQQQLAATRAMLPQAEQLLRLRELQLATLLGRDPSNHGLPADVAGVPELPPRPGVGTPADLLEDRPDLVAAQARYRSSRARVAGAGLSFAPTFRLSGNVGYQLRLFKEWDTHETWGFGAAVSVPIFGGLQRWGSLQQARAAEDAAARSFSAATLTARAEVESALVREETDGRRLAALAEQLEASRVAYDESTRQYASGVVNYLVVLTSLASYQAAELNHLQAQRDLLGARVDLHTALGAPWAARLDRAGASR